MTFFHFAFGRVAPRRQGIYLIDEDYCGACWYASSNAARSLASLSP